MAGRAELVEQLRWYYSRMYPAKSLHRWLSYEDPLLFCHREISFTLADDVYIRYRSFESAEELVATLRDRAPVKIDFGAVYNAPPRDKYSYSGTLLPQQKELVFDIDMTDYKDVMAELKEGSEVVVCDNNWPYMAAAAKIIDAALRQNFGFRHILWVYSGRRGIHCWVADERARRLTNEQRSAVVNHLHLRMVNRDNVGRRTEELTNPLHPVLAAAKRDECELLWDTFVLEQQGILDTPERVSNLLRLVPSAAVRGALEERLNGATVRKLPGKDKWQRIQQELRRHGELLPTLDYIVLYHTYPRLDVNVSKDMGHLLKAPFCVHPGTGRVCVPFEVAEAAEFVPSRDAPTLEALIAESNAESEGVMADADGERRLAGAHASLERAKGVLDSFVHALCRELRDESDQHRLNEIDRRGAADFISASSLLRRRERV